MSVRILLAIPCLLALAGGPGRAAVPSGDIRDLKLRDWEPRSMLVTKSTIVEKPRFPVIDIHNHLGGGKDLTPERVQRYLTGPMIAADDQQFLTRRCVPPRRIVVHAAVAHVHAIDDGIATRSAALDDPPTHGTDIVIH